MSKQKVIFLYCSPAGESRLNDMLQERIGSLPPKDGGKIVAFFANAIHKSPEGHSIRIWFDVKYPDSSPAPSVLEGFVKSTPVEEIFFARIGEEPDDVEEIGSYERMKLPEEK